MNRYDTGDLPTDAIFHLTRNPVSFDGYTVPAGTLILWSECIEYDPQDDSKDLYAPGVLMRGGAKVGSAILGMEFHRRDVVQVEWKWPLRRVILRTDQTEALECGHKVDCTYLYGKPKRRRCEACRVPRAHRPDERRLVEHLVEHEQSA